VNEKEKRVKKRKTILFAVNEIRAKFQNHLADFGKTVDVRVRERVYTPPVAGKVIVVG
jgi:hypothetical protein